MSEINFKENAKDLGISPKDLENEFNTQLNILKKNNQKPIKQGDKEISIEDMALNAAKVNIFNGTLNRQLPATVYIVGQSPTKQAKSEKKTKFKTVYLVVDLAKSAGMLRKKDVVEDKILITATQWSSQPYSSGYYTCKLRPNDNFYVINNIETLQESKKHSEDFGITLEEFDISDIDPTRIIKIVKRYPVKEFESSFKEGEKYETVTFDVLSKTSAGTIEQIVMSTGSTKVWGNPHLDESKTYKVIVNQKGKYYNFDGSLEIVDDDPELEEKVKAVTPMSFSASEGEEGNNNLYTFKILDMSNIRTGTKKDGSPYSMAFLTLLAKQGDKQPEIISCSTFKESWFSLERNKNQLYEGLIFRNEYNTLTSDPKEVSGDIRIEDIEVKKLHSFSKLDPESKEIFMLIGYPEKPPVFSEKDDGSKQAFVTITDSDNYEVTITAFDGSVMEDAVDSEGRLPGIIGVIGTLREYKDKVNIIPLKIVEADDSVEIEEISEDEEVWG